ncbi:DNA polymerase III subunit gamma/tau [Spirochaeta lutea]|uniref:DNA polymerase III subunit gamma/tau n=1 Tax=Spirochaeta lutea TaxID=1480694 RepID=UPI00068C3576|nr:DNA polymerase III subunit gamma/tau [Spirochaeta lutea]
MAYEVTASRKRPKTFDHLVGQEFVVATLKNSLVSGRIAHAYLFSGPRGVGKTSAARILARALNCPGGPSAEACLDYPGGEEISRGTAIDVIEIDGASNTSVNDVRAIKDEVLFPPQSSRYKIYIIDEVHMLSNSAFNALLKTIEEPPPYIVFIFATTEIHKVPATIRSRCQQFSFRLIPLEQIRTLLAEACDEMNIEAESEALTWIAKEATGSLRDAYTLFDQVISFSEGRISMEKIREKLGLIGLDRVNEFAEVLVQGNGHEALEQLDKILSAGISIEQFITDLSEYFRSVLFLKHGITREHLLGASPGRFSNLVQDGLSAVQLERLLELLLQTYRNIRYSLNPRFDIEVFVSKACGITRYLTLEDALRELAELKTGIAGDASHLKASGNTTEEPKHLRQPTVPSSPQSAKKQDYSNQGARGDVSGSEPPQSPGSTQVGAGTQGGSDTRSGAGTQDGSGTREGGHPGTESQPESPKDVQTRQEITPMNSGGTDGRSTSPAADNPDVISESHQREVIEAVKHDNATLAITLGTALEWRLDGDTLVLTFDKPYNAKVINQEASTLGAYIERLLMPGLKLKALVKQTSSREGTGLDPNVQRVQEVFRGQIIDESEVRSESDGSL